MKTPAQKRKEAREARAADPYAYQRSQERKEAKAKRMPRRPPVRPPPKKKELPDILGDITDVAAARMRLYLKQYPDQMDHDRDILLLDIHRMLKELTNK